MGPLSLLLLSLPYASFNVRCHTQIKNGGGKRIRTAGLLLARQALSQLSYTPTEDNMVGLSGFEPLTSRLSGARSDQLSYRPNIFFFLGKQEPFTY